VEQPATNQAQKVDRDLKIEYPILRQGLHSRRHVDSIVSSAIGGVGDGSALGSGRMSERRYKYHE